VGKYLTKRQKLKRIIKKKKEGKKKRIINKERAAQRWNFIVLSVAMLP